ncbi:Protein kinase, catalytic domain-containing protein [Cynara cardunculus var. scolymus]|uniref:Protein kinase, catalytic domain-containing protein n=1 Tax=Cynara cardunculus var. scolymus TaxID=59895 RepID=A0A103XSF9_CYNCS|nr:Protein kinase, catalytic domain-containing protein [Cynara cardunculus var. scolymus]
MGICCSSNNQASSATPNPSSGISQTTTTSNGTSSLLSVVSSNVSGNSQFSSASSGDDVGPGGQILPHPNLKIYSFAELKSATKNFRNDTVLGEGGFGKVHKGWLEEKSGSKHNGSGSVIAAEVNFLGRLSHPNLVKLLGYCYEGKELLLVYEFMQKGSLENHLFGSKNSLQGQSHVTTRVMGTYGYAAPEYVTTGHLYVKSDVYGFGVVLVEMLTGMRTLDPNRPVPQRNLVDWVKPMLANRRKLKNIMDSRLEGRYPSKATGRIAQLAFTCLETEPKSRPSMKEVVETLERLDAINEKPKVPRTQNSNRNSSNRYGLQPLHHRSPLHVKQDVDEGSKHLPKGS